MKELNLTKQMKINLKEQVKQELKPLSSKVPNYEELSLMEKAKVEKYIEQIDLSNLDTINNLGEKTSEDIFEELNNLFDMIQKHNTVVEAMFVETMLKIDENSKLRKNSEKSFVQQFKESPIAAFTKFKNTTKKTSFTDKRSELLVSIEQLKEKIEEIQNELKQNNRTLEKMAENEREEYSNLQCQIIALETMKKHIKNEQKDKKSEAKTFNQIEEKIKLSGIEGRIDRKIEECKNANINVANKAIMIRLLIQHNEKCISKYDQDILVSLPNLTQNVITSEADNSLAQDIEICNELSEKLETKIKKAKEEKDKINGNIVKVKVVANNV